MPLPCLRPLTRVSLHSTEPRINPWPAPKNKTLAVPPPPPSASRSSSGSPPKSSATTGTRRNPRVPVAPLRPPGVPHPHARPPARGWIPVPKLPPRCRSEAPPRMARRRRFRRLHQRQLPGLDAHHELHSFPFVLVHCQCLHVVAGLLRQPSPDGDILIELRGGHSHGVPTNRIRTLTPAQTANDHRHCPESD